MHKGDRLRTSDDCLCWANGIGIACGAVVGVVESMPKVFVQMRVPVAKGFQHRVTSVFRWPLSTMHRNWSFLVSQVCHKCQSNGWSLRKEDSTKEKHKTAYPMARCATRQWGR